MQEGGACLTSSRRCFDPCLSHMSCCSTLNEMARASQNPMSIKNAPSYVKSDRGLVLDAIKKDPNAALHASEQLTHDPQVR